jgi:glycosyltransferase involved in cell wall biosynthesis
MIDTALSFVIPTYRLRDVGDAVRAYDENFYRNGHTVPIIVFDDSSAANHDKYYANLEHTRTHNELFYVGPREKEQLITTICTRLRDKKLDVLVRNLFRPSYGGNRNFGLMYTLGDLIVSADDDMRPFGLIEDSPESLGEREVSRGKLLPRGVNGHTRKSFDVLRSFRDVLGKTTVEAPSNYERGALLLDTSVDLESNCSIGLSRENSLLLEEGRVPRRAIIKMGQTFRTGTNDIDAVDFIDMFLEDHTQTDAESLNDTYVLVNFRLCVTDKNWRMDCGVAGYDNTHGLPPFFPTRLRFEDYIYRLWIQQPQIAAAHVDSVQTHIKSNYMRNPLASEAFNEAICGLLKRKIRESVGKRDELTIGFDYDGSVSLQDTKEILDSAAALHSRVLEAKTSARSEARSQALALFSASLSRAFYDFEPDFFQQNVSRIVSDEVGRIRSSLEIWPTLLEIVYFQRKCRTLPIRLVKNKERLGNGKHAA